MNIIALGFIGSLGAGLMTAVGAFPILIGQTVSRRMNDAFLGFAAGIMLSASYFSLIIPGLDIAAEQYGTGAIPALIASGGVLLGAFVIQFLDKTVPHQHFIKGYEGPKAKAVGKIWLFVIAITLHNVPEGLAVGVGFAGGDIGAATSLALGIGLQNAPEGLAVALALRSEGYSKIYAFLVAAATGLVEPVAGLAGVAAFSVSQFFLPLGLTFAAGAMIYVISNEIIPETHRHGHHTGATTGLVLGVVVMMFLDVLFG
ncbi:ZIP family metal transporter [Sulfitobacter sp. S223]|uniref:ZIP family metal transporter n=1 Tax=Sulfitobacter sp. S223 TaxID=2867023 RepID=UPI0021A28146|nr:ZIP family metal transporter [Sulfitobacter sp. S223]UWR26724.1 ZIP family metal transporter [Sulfitobacter sp. S223]